MQKFPCHNGEYIWGHGGLLMVDQRGEEGNRGQLLSMDKEDNFRRCWTGQAWQVGEMDSSLGISKKVISVSLSSLDIGSDICNRYTVIL